MSVGRVVGVLVGILVIFWIISSPATAAHTVNTILAGLASAGASVILFLRGVV
ncbi:MAG TPA: hypothetical protein VGH76_14565 [Actinomycetospora sp.]|uniref:hypothetical protein n=1 Tax=Actinomycetospora sp. TaxID=1872135 RepID=UPI002F3E63E6